MQALLLYDEGAVDFCGESIAKDVEKTLHDRGFEVVSHVLKKADMRPCVGCFGCWLKTPGYCVFTDDINNDLNRIFINSHTVVFISEIMYGGYSAHIKRYLDRIIPLVLPDFEKINGETHHKKRYDRYPNYLTIGYGTNVTVGEKKTFQKLLERNNLNFHSPAGASFVMGNLEEYTTAMKELALFMSKEVAI